MRRGGPPVVYAGRPFGPGRLPWPLAESCSMRRTDRLFQMIQFLRGRRVSTAREIAAELGVSERTVYRHVQDLVAAGVPIEGEAGVGYMLRDYDLPPLMFDGEEIEALVLGLRVVESWADPGLASAARSVLAKVEQILPGAKLSLLRDTQLYAPGHDRPNVSIDGAEMRGAIRRRAKVMLDYADAAGAHSERCVRPLALTFYGPVWLLLAWCELRDDFRTFRLDRIRGAWILTETFDAEPGKTLEDFLAKLREQEWPPKAGEECSPSE